MAGEGEYNRHSQPQHAAGEGGLPLLARASEAVPLDRELRIADYGSSQGRNSLAPMRLAIQTLRGRGARGSISVVHTDLPSNDFAALFETLAEDPHSYLREQDVFAYAAGRSFYEQLFPAGHVALGWSSIAVHWLSEVPEPLREHVFSPLGSAAERAAYAARAAEDWERFLGHRLVELVPDGQLAIVGSGADEHGFSGAEGLMNIANEALREMLAEGELSREDYEGMAIPTYYRTREEFLAPLEGSGSFAESLAVEECSQTALEDPLWARYEQSGDLSGFAASAAGFLRAFSEPSLFGAIASEQGAPAAARLAEDFYARVRKRIAEDPPQARCAWRLVLLRIAKRG